MKTPVSTILAIILLFAFSCDTFAKRKKMDKDTFQWRYEIEPAIGQAKQGSCLVKVWTYARRTDEAKTQAAKNAVHGIIFKGYAASTDGSRLPAQKALVTDYETEKNHSAYFEEFFKDGGRYMRFVTLVNNGIPGHGDLIKVGKEYKIGIIVSVKKDDLRKELETTGIIRALNAGF